MTVTVPANLLAAVSLAQESEGACFYLMGVHFADRVMVATNGHVLTAAPLVAPIESDPITLPVSKKLFAALKNKKAETATWANGVWTVLDENGNTLHLEPAKAVEGTFPDWRRAIPGGDAIVTDATFLFPVLDAITATAKVLGAAGYALRGADCQSPHVVRYCNQADVFTVAMPARGSVPDDGQLPGWLNSDKPAEA